MRLFIDFLLGVLYIDIEDAFGPFLFSLGMLVLYLTFALIGSSSSAT